MMDVFGGKIPLSTKIRSKVCLQKKKMAYTRSQSWVCFGCHVQGLSFDAQTSQGKGILAAFKLPKRTKGAISQESQRAVIKS
jgi:hypothetical protein